MPFLRRWSRLALLLPLACGNPPLPSDDVVKSARPSSESLVETSNGNLDSAVVATPEPLSAPRRASAARLRALWTHESAPDPEILLHPVDVRITDLGVLVSDYGRHSIRAFDSKTGALTTEWGRYGHGPLEFVNPPLIIGRADNPLVFDARTGRAHWLNEVPARTLFVDRARPWMSGCQMADGKLLLAASPRPTGSAFAASEIGVNPVASDSLDHPIVRIRAVGWFAQQTALYQADDTTCVIAPVFHREFALVDRLDRISPASGVEELPPAEMETERNGKSITYSMTRGARGAHRGAATWRNQLLVLAEGTTSLKDRLLDIYSRDDLSYRGTIVLPFRSHRIATRGDTLAVIAEDEDVLFLALYLLVP